MSRAQTSFIVIWRIALRNILSNKVKSSIVGSIMVFGTMLLVIGTAMLDSVEASMQKVVTSSLAGQLQVYSSKSKDELSLFGGLTASLPEIGEIEDFSKVQENLGDIDNVRAIVPMGITISTGTSGNDIDEVLSELRRAVQTDNEAGVEALSGQIRDIASSFLSEYDEKEKITNDMERLKRERAVLEEVRTDAFWDEFTRDPQAQLLWLDTKLAPLASNGRLFFMRVLGTDPQAFKQHFDRFEIAKGEMIPPNQRGLLISKRTHERFLKHKVARGLDRIKQEMELEDRTIQDDELLQARVRRLSRQYRRITFQLDPGEVAELRPKLSAQVGDAVASDASIQDLISELLNVTDENFYERYAFFYEEVGPRIELYRINVGDVVPLQSFTRRGYIKAVNVKVWGTFQFKGIEDSDLAGVVNIADLITFRELYGKMTAAQRAELESLRKEIGVEDVSRSSAEDDLFGGSEDSLQVEDESGAENFDEFEGVEVMERAERLASVEELKYEQSELDEGLALNAAIILDNPDDIVRTRAAIEQRIAERGLELKVVDWQEASGLVGQLIIVIRLVLYIAIFIIFLVALVIINNSMVMATMERISEVGTMRAIGAQRSFILVLFMLETLVLGVAAGALGALLGVAVIATLGVVGLPASNEIVRFIFAGPRLYPHVSVSNVVIAASVIFGVSVLSTLYPAIVATRIQPVVAMRGRD